MSLPPQFLDELRARVGLSDIVLKRMRMQRAGKEWKAPCPFHKEKTPSFYVNDAKGFYHCFGCGAHGDALGFVMRHDNLAFMEAVELLAGEAGLQVPQSSPQDREQFERQRSLYDLVERATGWFERQLQAPGGRVALAYLRGRGLEDATIARFRLGYAPPDGGPLKAELLKAGFGEADLLEAGLYRQPDDNRSSYAFFRNRVMFPVTDRRGRVVAFGARILEGEGPKYVNSADNPLFHKGKLLFNMSRARQAAADGKPVLVTEGYMDVISCVTAGFEGAVAPLGTAMTETQILELWKLLPEGRRVPILCFDGDNAGRRAAERAVERILPLLLPDHSARVAFMPDREDPDSLIRSGGAPALQAVLDRAVPLADVLWEMEARGRILSNPDQKAGLEAAVRARIATINDANVRRAYEQDLRDRMFKAGRRTATGVKPAFVPGRRPEPPLPGTGHFDPKFRRQPPPAGEMRERLLLAVLLHHPAMFELNAESLAALEFRSPDAEQVRQGLLRVLGTDSTLDAAELRRHLSQYGYAESVDAVLSGMSHPAARSDSTPEAAHRLLKEILSILALDQVRTERLKAELEGVRGGDSEGPRQRSEALRKELVQKLGFGTEDGPEG
jgi:DNA primase